VSFDQPGTVRVESRDREIQARIDVLWDLGRHYLEAGAEAGRRTVETSLLSPFFGTSAFRGSGFGFYVQDKFRLSNRTYLHLGGRASAMDASGLRWSFDPRLSAAFFVTKRDIVRASAGLYHQVGDAAATGRNPGLVAKAAAHFALSYDRVGEPLDVRIALYDKEYRRLFVAAPGGRLENSGRGYARGGEFFLKRKAPSYEAILVYNFLSSKRRENEVPVLAPSPYEIPHSATAILSWKLKNGTIGVRASVASGRPYTPPGENPMSGRTPVYHRLDLNGSLRVEAFGRMVVLYLGVTNLFNSPNILRYEYDAETGSRTDQPSIFGRSLFAGLYVPFF